MKGISVIVPVYNEEEIIEKNTGTLLRFMKSCGEPFEIIIVSNGSTDKTETMGKTLQKKNKMIKFLFLKERGVGAAFREGVNKASYEKIVSLDMDLTTDLNFVKEASRLLEKYCAVVGSKQIGYQERPFARRLASDIYIMITKNFLNLEFTDYSIGSKAFNKRHITKFLARIDNGSFYVVQVLSWLKREHTPMKEIPVRCYDKRKSKFNIIYESYYRFAKLLIFLVLENLSSIIRPSRGSK